MFYKVIRYLALKDYFTDKGKDPTWVFNTKLYDGDLASIYYRTVLHAQEAADEDNEKNDATNKNNEVRVDTVSSIEQMSKEDYVKYIISMAGYNNTIIYNPRRTLTSKLFGKAFLYNLILSWDEYLEEVYV